MTKISFISFSIVAFAQVFKENVCASDIEWLVVRLSRDKNKIKGETFARSGWPEGSSRCHGNSRSK